MILVLGALAVMTLAASRPQDVGAPSQDCAQAERLVSDAIGRGTPEAGDLAVLLQTYQRALTMCPDAPEALNALGDTLERLGRLDGAVDAYRRAAQARPDWATPLFGLGDAYRKLGRTGDALYWYRKGLELKPDDSETLAQVRELAASDPPGLIGSRSIRDILESARGPGVVAQSVSLNEGVLPFAYGSAVPKSQAYPQIRELAFALLDVLGAYSRGPGVVETAGPPIAEIDGHTDRRGTDSFNFALGLRRAEAVIDVLVRDYRIPRGRLVVKSYGRSRLLCNEDTERCHAQNRRVEIRRPEVP